MKITELDLQAEGKKYFCKDVNEVFKVKCGNLIAITRSFSMADLLKFDFEEIKETKTPYERVNIDERYYFVNTIGEVNYIEELNDYIDNKQFNSLNYFNNKNYAKYVGFKETLMRKLDRFAWEHNAKAVKWDCNQSKYYIIFNYYGNKKLEVCGCFSMQSNDIYFTSKDDLMKLYTWKFDF